MYIMLAVTVNGLL